MKRWLAAAALGVCTALSLNLPAQASPSVPPPPPPPPPYCHSCAPPPNPPTPVPTVAPTAVPVQPLVVATISTPKVSRGHTEKVQIDASENDEVTVVVQYHKGKPVTYHSKVGSSNTIVKEFKVPKNAPVGRAAVSVEVKGQAPFLKTFTFVVTK